MLEDFLTDIYEKAMTLELIKEASYYSSIRHIYNRKDLWNEATAYIEKILYDLKESDIKKAAELLDGAQKAQASFSNWHTFSAAIDTEVVPKVTEYLKKFTGIEVDDGKWTLESSQTGFLTIKNNKLGYLHSPSDPMWESFLYAESIFDLDADNYYILGGGLGYLAYQLWRMSEGEADIYVFEVDKELSEYAELYGVLSFIPEDKIHVITGDDTDSILEQYQKNRPCEKTVRTIYHWDYANYKGTYADYFKVQISNEVTGRACEVRWRKNYNSNMRLDHKFLSDLNKNAFKDEWVVVGAGPSLNDNVDFIKESVGKRTICAINASIKWFSRNDVLPDVCTVCDPLDSLIPHIEGVEGFSKDIPLVADPIANRAFVEMYKGPRYYVFSTVTAMTAGVDKVVGDMWEIGGTVTSMAIELAYRMGAKKIHVIGADLAYPDAVTYADGVGHDVGKWNVNEETVVSVDDKMIPTSIKFYEYKTMIEEQIAAYRNVEVINRSLHGAYINGTFCGQWWENLSVDSDVNAYSKLFEILKRDSNLLDWKKKYYIFWQIIARMESAGVSPNFEIETIIDDAYKAIYESFKNELNWEMASAGIKAKGQTYIFADEYIDDKDPASKRVLNIAKTEADKNQKILIVNTTEKYGGEKVPLHDSIEAQKNKKSESVDTVFWGNRSFTYFQFPDGMPDIKYYRAFLDSISESIPDKMISASKFSLIADYCREKMGVPFEKA